MQATEFMNDIAELFNEEGDPSTRVGVRINNVCYEIAFLEKTEDADGTPYIVIEATEDSGL